MAMPNPGGVGGNNNANMGYPHGVDFGPMMCGPYNMPPSSYPFVQGQRPYPFESKSSQEGAGLTMGSSLPSAASSTRNGSVDETKSSEKEWENFTIGDEVIYGKENGTVVSLDWNRTPPQAEVRMHTSNFIMKIPMSQLTLWRQENQYLVDKSSLKENTPK
ncbi:hypothetical protein RFI_02222 [Reticulomyxa filosa]|uniref:Uncharacterized protein n=1 Tax=Reticulomyxa filosa TaxID=46433 RepID=X6PB62_RETFI|nr:hypothetical protein RFI_02222 [Reticulomyxa filosa]|eukprot:ETO34867.1 hypothetical protein RFI_02222 [Reticulomyxa filosa]